MWLIGLGLFIFGVCLLVLGGIFFITLILIPFAIIAGLIGIVLLIAGAIAAILHPTHRHHYHVTQEPTTQQQAVPGQVKYCTRCGTANAVQNEYCAKCGKKFLE
jgi:membrane-bound ClpP family serine protease